MSRWLVKVALVALVAVAGLSGQASAQQGTAQPHRFTYYPYYYFPHNYWPQNSAPWPEKPGEPYQKPPAYMAYPTFREPNWRYELWTPMKYHRGSHFWLDQF